MNIVTLLNGQKEYIDEIDVRMNGRRFRVHKIVTRQDNAKIDVWRRVRKDGDSPKYNGYLYITGKNLVFTSDFENYEVLLTADKDLSSIKLANGTYYAYAIPRSDNEQNPLTDDNYGVYTSRDLENWVRHPFNVHTSTGSDETQYSREGTADIRIECFEGMFYRAIYHGGTRKLAYSDNGYDWIIGPTLGEVIPYSIAGIRNGNYAYIVVSSAYNGSSRSTTFVAFNCNDLSNATTVFSLSAQATLYKHAMLFPNDTTLCFSVTSRRYSPVDITLSSSGSFSTKYDESERYSWAVQPSTKYGLETGYANIFINGVELPVSLDNNFYSFIQSGSDKLIVFDKEKIRYTVTPDGTVTKHGVCQYDNPLLSYDRSTQTFIDNRTSQ